MSHAVFLLLSTLPGGFVCGPHLVITVLVCFSIWVKFKLFLKVLHWQSLDEQHTDLF